jgi:cell division transport system permease protein
MTFRDLKRVLRSGLVGFFRNGLVSLSSVLVMVITASVLVGIVMFQSVLVFSVDRLNDQIDITVYFDLGAPEGEILDVKESLETLPEVAYVEYISAPEALALFQEKHKNDATILQALDEVGGNPIPAYLNIKALDSSQYESIATFLEDGGVLSASNRDSIDSITYFENELVIERLTNVITGIRQVGLGSMIVLIAISIAFNTIRLVIFISRDEIRVMRLVGAHGNYIKGPFVIQGILYGLIASVVTMVLFYPITKWLSQNLSSFLELNLFEYYAANFVQLLVIAVLATCFLGVVSSLLAARKYLNR